MKTTKQARRDAMQLYRLSGAAGGAVARSRRGMFVIGTAFGGKMVGRE
jgi:hypothetical protein